MKLALLMASVLLVSPTGLGVAGAEPAPPVGLAEESVPAEVRAAEAIRLSGQLARARQAFVDARAVARSPAERDAASLGVAVCDVEAGRASGNALASLELLDPVPVPQTLDAARWTLLAEAHARSGDRAASVRRWLARAWARTPTDSPLRSRLARLGASEPAGMLPEPPERIAERLRDALQRSSWEEAAPLATLLQGAAEPGSALAQEGVYGERRAQARVATEPRRVLLLLPLTGELGVPAGQLRDAFAMGAGTEVQLDVVDTHGDPAACVRALEEGVIEKGASLVVGPMRKEEAALCAPAAQALRVPMVTLTSSSEGMSAGDLVFRGYLSVEQQIAALLDESMGVRGMKRFAILHPQNAFGESAAATFEAAVQARGGSIVQKQSYPTEQRDYRPVARALWRKDPQTGKPTLIPAVDYDGVFVPDRYQATALLASAMGYEELPVGQFRPRGARGGLLLMGLNAWNHHDFPRRGGVYVRGSMFVDAFHAESQDPAVVDFVTAWQARGAGRPGTIEGIGLDLGLLVRAAVAKGGGIAGLRAAQVDAPVAGTSAMGPDRQANRRLRVLTVTAAGIEPFPAFTESAPVEDTPPP